jgi:hypothetical protein
MEPVVGRKRRATPQGGKSGRLKKLSSIVAIAALAACVSCTAPDGGSPQSSGSPPGSGEAQVTTPNDSSTASANPQEVPPPGSATAPEPPATTGPGGELDHLGGSMSATTPDQYTFDVSFNLGVGSTTTANIANAKPGQVNVNWYTPTIGDVTITNTTPGHTLPVPYEFALSCIHVRGVVGSGCPTLYSFYPAGSPVCTAEGPGGGRGIFLAYPAFSPSGNWCAVKWANAPFSQVPDGTVVPISGTLTSEWQGQDHHGVLLHEADYSALASALAAKPKHWEIEASTAGGAENTKRTPQTPPGCDSLSYVIWSSTPLVCSKSS